ncbi:MAG: nuclear transport factor 2 family protein [Blastocatellia bacterium]|nr:nuclear transport factor 2 family protein [Blastocatellia bacterium]
MDKILILSFIFILSSLTYVTYNQEEDAVQIPIQNYFKGQATGNPEYIRKAFHPDAKLFFIHEGRYSQLTLDEFTARFNGKPAPDEMERKRSIEKIDISGNAAMVKLILKYPTVTFTDYMSLLKIEGEWKIVNKTFYAEAK